MHTSTGLGSSKDSAPRNCHVQLFRGHLDPILPLFQFLLFEMPTRAISKVTSHAHVFFARAI